MAGRPSHNECRRGQKGGSDNEGDYITGVSCLLGPCYCLLMVTLRLYFLFFVLRDRVLGVFRSVLVGPASVLWGGRLPPPPLVRLLARSCPSVWLRFLFLYFDSDV